MESNEHTEQMIQKYLDAGGPPDYVIITTKDFSEFPDGTEVMVMSRAEFERLTK